MPNPGNQFVIGLCFDAYLNTTDYTTPWDNFAHLTGSFASGARLGTNKLAHHVLFDGQAGADGSQALR
jgi:hypothetical protein